MYHGKKILALIPARYGSKGIPHKNIRPIMGKPLFMHSVDYAKTSKYVDDILVSSDSQEVLTLAHAAGCVKNGLRPAELASDTARNIDAILWELAQQPVQYDAIIQLQPTYPIRPADELDSMIEKYFETETSLITVVKCNDRPEFMRRIADNGKLEKIMLTTSEVRLINFIQYYKIVGSVYINNAHTLTSDVILNENEVPFVINDYYSLDIDTEADWDELERRCANKP